MCSFTINISYMIHYISKYVEIGSQALFRIGLHKQCGFKSHYLHIASEINKGINIIDIQYLFRCLIIINIDTHLL